MERIADFGSFTVNQQLDLLESRLKKGDILLFQYYEETDGAMQSQERIDEYFENYCDDLIYYYNPDLRAEIYNSIIHELLKEAGDLGERRAKRQYARIKTGDAANISEKTIENIKRIVFNKLINHNKNIIQYEYVLKRMYEKSQWIVDERGKVSGTGGAIWYKPVNRDEYCDVLKFFPLFSCIILQNGEKVDHFSVAYTVQETADTYDLLMFEND